MITYNWDLGIKLFILYMIFNILLVIIYGVIGVEKDRSFSIWDSILGCALLVLMVIPVFF
jgi:hypothetical protein